VDTLLLADMTEFGKPPLLTAKQLFNVGDNVVIYLVTTPRLAMYAVELGPREIADTGTQSSLLNRMQHHSCRYELPRYTDYNQFDSDSYNFALEGVTS
jgi:methylisocitrate lyase